MAKLYNQKSQTRKRQDLRRQMPHAEIELWKYLRNRQIYNTKFRRQHSIGAYVVDFYATKPRLAIEIDGDSHFLDDAPAYDKQRQQYIEACGIRFLRFTNNQIKKNLPAVLEIIESALRQLLRERGENHGL
jgi:very-short-patch-repair endonuclease